MLIEAATLPDDPEALRALIAAQAAELAAARAGLVAKALEIETLKLQIARLRRPDLRPVLGEARPRDRPAGAVAGRAGRG